MPGCFQRVYVQRTTSATSQHGAAQPQARTRNVHPVTGLQARQLTPAQTRERQHRHHIAVAALACLGQLPQLAKGERLALTPSTAAGRIANRRRHVVLHPSVGHREREDRSQCGQGASRGRRRQAASHQRADLGRTSAAVIKAAPLRTAAGALRRRALRWGRPPGTGAPRWSAGRRLIRLIQTPLALRGAIFLGFDCPARRIASRSPSGRRFAMASANLDPAPTRKDLAPVRKKGAEQGTARQGAGVTFGTWKDFRHRSC